MSHPDIPPQNAEALPRELLELAEHIAALPKALQGDLVESFEKVVESTKRRKRILNLVQEALSQLRLDVKYLMFDLEVTREERDQLQQRLSEID